MAKWDFSSVWRSPRCTDPGADEFACTKKTRVRSSRNPAPATPRRILRVRLGHRQPLALFLAAPTRSEPFARPASFRGGGAKQPDGDAGGGDHSQTTAEVRIRSSPRWAQASGPTLENLLSSRSGVPPRRG